MGKNRVRASLTNLSTLTNQVSNDEADTLAIAITFPHTKEWEEFQDNDQTQDGKVT